MCAGLIPEGARDAILLSFGTVLEEGESFSSPRVLDAIGGARGWRSWSTRRWVPTSRAS